MVLTGLGTSDVHAWISSAVRALERHRGAIDAINVYPVADADTGTNLHDTLRGALAELEVVLVDAEHGQPSVADAARALARGALGAARGNSGVLLSQVLRGFADAAPASGELDAAGLRAALMTASRLARQAVSEPAPGTMLTVLAALADRLDHSADESLEACTGTVLATAERAVRATRAQLGALADAGVVDAGAYGLLVLLSELRNTVTGTREATLPEPGRASFAGRHGGEQAGSSYQYEVMYLLDGADPDRVATLTKRLTEIGDSVSVAGSGDTGGDTDRGDTDNGDGDAVRYSVHVHCDDVGAAIEAGIDAGRPHRITVARFGDEVTALTRFTTDRAVVTIARGEGVAALFRAEGAHVLVLEPDTEPTAWDVLAVLTGTRAATVTVLSNEPELAGIIQAGVGAAREAGQTVTVVPTMSPVQGLAAMAVHDPSRRIEDDVVAMAEAAAATRRGALVLADQEALTWAGRCVPGDVLGMIDGEVVFVRHPVTLDAGETVAHAAAELLDRMLDSGGELVTALLGAAAAEDLGEALRAAARAEHPVVELTVYTGGQHDAVLVLGVE